MIRSIQVTGIIVGMHLIGSAVLFGYLRELEDECGFNNERIAPDTRARTGDTPLHIAAIQGNLRAIVLLLEEGAELNARGEGGMTPLHYAIQMEQVEAIKILLEYEADYSVINDFGDTPASMARMKDPHVEALLQKKSGVPPNA